MVDKSTEQSLFDNQVYEAWQFVENTEKTLLTAKYCNETILRLLSTMIDEHEEWKNSLWTNLMSQETKVKKVSITTDNLPAHTVDIAGENIPIRFLLDKSTKDFFQYTRNVFDSISQIANAALLGSKSKKLDSVDFPAMLKVFNQQTYNQSFPHICTWYNAIATSDEFQYIEAFNNRTKHTCDVYLKVSMDFLSDNHSSNINPFFRKDVQHGKQNIVEYLNGIYEFANNSFTDFMTELKKEYVKKLYLDNRYNKLKGWQQKTKEHPESDFAVAFIESSTEIDAMPDEISILLISKCDDGTIYTKNCTEDLILVKKSGTEHDYIGCYVASEPCGDDTLLRYRKYQKDATTGPIVLHKAMREWQNKKTFYKANPFMDLITVSDDDEFLKRVQIPF